MSNNRPYDFQEAREAETKATLAQKGAEDFIKESYRAHALAEAAYRQRLAERIVELRAEGKAATLCKDLARGDKSVTSLMVASMIADGVKEAASQAAWRHSKDRDAVQRFVEWSMRRDLAEGNGMAQRRAAA
jgi:hypothetical protein